MADPPCEHCVALAAQLEAARRRIEKLTLENSALRRHIVGTLDDFSRLALCQDAATARANEVRRRNQHIADLGLPTATKGDWVRVRDALERDGFGRYSIAYLRRSYHSWLRDSGAFCR